MEQVTGRHIMDGGDGFKRWVGVHVGGVGEQVFGWRAAAARRITLGVCLFFFTAR